MSHYYEAHITIEPIPEDKQQEVRDIAKLYGFKLATLLMKKRDMDTPERSMYDTFMTAHHQSEATLQLRISGLCQMLKVLGYKVWRYKIEDVVLDSRVEDTLELLS